MHYFIDGYNLMFRVKPTDGNLKRQREEIIRDLGIKINALGLNVTLVFDAQYQNTESFRYHILHLEIYFTDVGETADEFILKVIKEKSKPHLCTVVTSDKKLAWLARRSHANTETVENFLSLLNRRHKNKLQVKKELKPLSSSQGMKKQVVPEPLVLGTSPEDYFDFYLKQFQESFLLLEEAALAKKEAKKLNKKSPLLNKNKKNKIISEGEKGESSMERWLRIFQQNVNLMEEK